MKNKWLWLVALAALATGIVVAGMKMQDQAPEVTPETSTSNSDLQTTTTSEAKERGVTEEKMVEVYVDPALYDTSSAEETPYDYVSVREKADTESEVLTKLHRGEWATYLGTEGDYVKVRADSGKEGYIPKANTNEVQTIQRLEKATDVSQLSVVLDAGHGGIDSGAESLDGNVYEKDLTLNTVKVVGKLLEENGVAVTYTRTDDTLLSLENVNKLSLKTNPDIFISIHYDNYDYPNQAHGFTTYYYYRDGQKLGNLVSQQLAASLPLTNNDVRFGNYYVIRQTYIPTSLLLELGYINSDHDLSEITKEDYPEKVAQGLLKSLEQYVAE